jgi:hypothetical protein
LTNSYDNEEKFGSKVLKSQGKNTDFKPMTSPRNKATRLDNKGKNNVGLTEKSICRESEAILVKFLKELIEVESRLENIKESFSLKPDVKIKDLFFCFDVGGTGNITPLQFKEILQMKLDIYADNEDIKLLFKKYDRDFDSKLNYPEFCEMVVPARQEYAKLMKERTTKSDKSITLESKLIFIKLVKSLLEGEKSIEMSRKALANKKLFSSYDQFDLIKRKYQNFILKEDVFTFDKFS